MNDKLFLYLTPHRASLEVSVNGVSRTTAAASMGDVLDGLDGRDRALFLRFAQAVIDYTAGGTVSFLEAQS